MRIELIISICCLSSLLLKAQKPVNSLDKSNSVIEKSPSQGTEARNEKFANTGFVKLKGKVVSAKTENALASAIIGIKGTSNSTFSDEMGQFEIDVPQHMNDTLVIMLIGYKRIEKSVREIEESSIRNFTLQEDLQLLDSVIVNGGYTGNEIIQLAIKNISKNYPDDPFVIEGLYRETQKENNRYVSLLEATVSIYDDEYEAPFFKSHLQERVALHEIRKSFQYNPKKYFNNYDKGLVNVNWLERGLLKNNSVGY